MSTSAHGDIAPMTLLNIFTIKYSLKYRVTNYIIPAQLKCEISIIKSIKISDMTCQAYMLKSSSHFTPHRHQYFIEHLQYVADVIFLGN